MGTTAADLERWQGLFDAAVRVYAMAPWTFMEETDLFGVEDPDSGELGFVSVMGMLGQHRAVAVYQGAKGLYDFLAVENHQGDVPPEGLLDMLQVQLSFENRSTLEREDRDLLATLGLTFKGRKTWPLCRSYRPSCLPWFPESDEIRLLHVALEQLLEIAPRFKGDPSCLEAGDDGAILMRSRATDGDTTEWRDSFMTVAPPEPERLEVRIDHELIDAVKRLPRAANPIEVDCFRTPTVVAERGKRPFFPYALMLGDSHSGMILQCDMLDPTPSLANMWGSIPARVLQEFLKVGSVPQHVEVADPVLGVLLGLIAPELRFAVREVRTLSALGPAQQSLLQQLAGGFGRPRRKQRNH